MIQSHVLFFCITVFHVTLSVYHKQYVSIWLVVIITEIFLRKSRYSAKERFLFYIAVILFSYYLIIYKTTSWIIKKQISPFLRDDQFYDHKHWAFCMSIISGIKYAPYSLSSSFRSLSMLHLLCVSGLHVQWIFSYITLLFKPISKMVNFDYFAHICGLVGTFYITLASIISYPSIRALYMLLFTVCGSLSERRTSSLNSLGTITIVWLLISPKSIFSLGLQYSYFLTLMLIITLSSLKCSHSNHTHPILKKFRDLISLQICCWISSIPISIIHGIPISFSSIPCNMFFSPIYIYLSSTGIILASIQPYLKINHILWAHSFMCLKFLNMIKYINPIQISFSNKSIGILLLIIYTYSILAIQHSRYRKA